jgi:hypothetical protein
VAVRSQIPFRILFPHRLAMFHPAPCSSARRFLGLVCVVAGLFCSTIASARADNPLPATQLTSVFPPGGKQGTTVYVELLGSDIENTTKLVFSHPGLSAVQKVAASQLESDPDVSLDPTFAVTISGTVPPGLYEVRAAGPYGISNPRTFAVGNSNEVVERAAADKLSAAREVPLESTISAAVHPERADYFKFAAKKGQRLLLEAWARRIDSRLDPRLILYDAAGHELARAKERFHRDPLLDFTAPADGSYVVKLYDFLYKGGPDYFYRLTLSTAPRLDFVMPPSGLAGTKSKYSLYGRNLPGGAATGEQTASGTPLERLDVEIALPASTASMPRIEGDAFGEPTEFAQDAFAYRLQTPRGEANPVNIYFATAPVVREQEPNDTPQQAQKITLPCEVVGQFNPRGDQDWYQFEAHKGDAWTIEVYSQRLGLSTDPFLLVQRVSHPVGKPEAMVDVAESDDPPPEQRQEQQAMFLNMEFDDPLVRFVAPEDGTYRIMVRDLYGQSRGSPEYVYRLAIRRPAPDFRVLLLQEAPRESDNLDKMDLWSAVVHKGRSTAVTALAQREDGFAGEIQLSVEGLPEGITCTGATIGPGADIASLVFTAGEKMAPWSGSVRVIAKARIGDRDVAHDVRTATSVWPVQQISQNAAQFRLASQFAIATSADAMPQIKIDLGDGKPLETAPGGNLKIPVKVTRGEKTKGRLKCRVIGACRGMNIPELDIPAEANEGSLQLNVNGQLPAGKYTFPVRAYATVNCRRNPEAADAATAKFKALEKIAADLTTAARQADETKKTAQKAATDAEAATRQSLEAVAAANRTLNESQQRAKAAADALAPLEKASAESAAKLQAADAAQALADKAAADTKGTDKNPAAVKAQAGAVDVARKAREESRQTDMRRDAARTVAQTAATQRMAAEAAKAAAEKKSADAAALVKTTTATRVAAETAATNAAAKSHAADAEKATAAERARRATEAAQARDYTVVFYSNPLVLQVDAAPIALSIAAPTKPTNPGEKVELPLLLERRFGFTTVVDAGLVLPPNVSGLHAGDVSIQAGQTKAALVVELDPKIKPGEYNVIVRARMNFNGQPSQLDQPVTIQVQSPEKKK